jgi:NADH-quinone oxidoreductase subunit L
VEPGEAGDAGEQVVAATPGTAPAVQAAAAGPHAEPHESPWLMTLPLVVLALLSIVGGVINLPFNDDVHFLEHFLEPVLGENEAHIAVSTDTKVTLAAIAVGAGLIGIAVAAAVYLRRRVRAVEPQVLARAWYYDAGVTAFMGGPGRKLFDGIAWFDRNVVDGTVNGVAMLVRTGGRGLRHVQSGFVRSYALGVSIGVVVLLGYFLTRVSF